MLEKTSGKIIAIAVVFIAAGLAFYLVYMQQQAQPVEQEPELDLGEIPTVEEGVGSGALAPNAGTCPNQATQYDKDLCWLWQATDERNADLCDNIQARVVISNCVDGIARTLADTEICGRKFPNDDYLRYHCIIQVARENLDYSLCDQMPPGYKTMCVTNLEMEEGIWSPPTE